jgi:hypothetical protein
MTTLFYPFVCFSCRKSFKRVWPPSGSATLPCPECGGQSFGLARKFRAPARSDAAQWKKVQFLVESGFRFGSLHDEQGERVPYPKTLKEAEAFVARYGKMVPAATRPKRRIEK